MTSNPAVVSFGYKNFRIDKVKCKWTGECKFCKSSISDKSGTTSGFTRYYRIHCHFVKLSEDLVNFVIRNAFKMSESLILRLTLALALTLSNYP